MLYHFLCKRGIRPARTEQFLVIYYFFNVPAFLHTQPTWLEPPPPPPSIGKLWNLARFEVSSWLVTSVNYHKEVAEAIFLYYSTIVLNGACCSS